jgi:hypothetical protein
MKRSCVFVTVFVLLATHVFSAINVANAASIDYKTAMTYSIKFFDANKCGPQAGTNNFFDWRGACHTDDGSSIGFDLTGGYHDAGDHVKFGLPQAYSASVLGWSFYEYKDVFDATGNTQNMLSTLKYFTDYMLKCHPDANTFYHQVGDGEEDHTYWGPPEEQAGKRPVPFVVNSSNPGSDVLGLTSASLTLMYLNYKDIDSSYASKCLKAAKELYEMGKSNLGHYTLDAFYQSHSYWDDLAWAAAWLYVVENDSSYLTDINSYLSNNTYLGVTPFENKWTMCWDDMYMAVFCKMAEITGEQKYKDAMEYNLNYWKSEITTTPGGLRFLDVWGALRYMSAEVMLALQYYKQTNDQSLLTFAKSQIDYALGDNPLKMSYLIGFGSNYPKHPHHRAANGYTYANGENANPAKHVLTGALVGGPDSRDDYHDSVHEFQYTEVAIDYNASFVAAVAGINKYYGGLVTPSTSTPPNTPPRVTNTPPESKLIWCDLGDVNADGTANSTDYAMIRRYLLGLIEKLPYQEMSNIKIPVADLNGDGSINSTDYALMRRYILGTLTEFPVEYDINGKIIKN